MSVGISPMRQPHRLAALTHTADDSQGTSYPEVAAPAARHAHEVCSSTSRSVLPLKRARFSENSATIFLLLGTAWRFVELSSCGDTNSTPPVESPKAFIIEVRRRCASSSEGVPVTLSVSLSQNGRWASPTGRDDEWVQ